MARHRIREIAYRLGLLLGSIVLGLALVEAGYRILDPYPFIGPEEITAAEHGSLIQYDPALGWKGVPGGRMEMVTRNRRVRVEYNSRGFRDVEHGESPGEGPAIVFLGDSFTEGFEVAFDEMFVSLLRERLPEHTVINLGLRGYGTDQALLAFRSFVHEGPLERVVLMFSDNDVDDNNSDFRYEKFKPRFRLKGGTLELTGVPVPRVRAWRMGAPGRSPHLTARERLRRIFLKSHLVHDVLFRIEASRRPTTIPMTPFAEWDLSVTREILRELKREVTSRGARLTVVTIPSKIEIEKLNDWPPYQDAIAGLCAELGIDHLDLAPEFRHTWLRTYYRHGGHWNARGHAIAAAAIERHLRPPPEG